MPPPQRPFNPSECGSLNTRFPNHQIAPGANFHAGVPDQVIAVVVQPRVCYDVVGYVVNDPRVKPKVFNLAPQSSTPQRPPTLVANASAFVPNRQPNHPRKSATSKPRMPYSQVAKTTAAGPIIQKNTAASTTQAGISMGPTPGIPSQTRHPSQISATKTSTESNAQRPKTNVVLKTDGGTSLASARHVTGESEKQSAYAQINHIPSKVSENKLRPNVQVGKQLSKPGAIQSSREKPSVIESSTLSENSMKNIETSKNKGKNKTTEHTETLTSAKTSKNSEMDSGNVSSNVQKPSQIPKSSNFGEWEEVVNKKSSRTKSRKPIDHQNLEEVHPGFDSHGSSSSKFTGKSSITQDHRILNDQSDEKERSSRMKTEKGGRIIQQDVQSNSIPSGGGLNEMGENDSESDSKLESEEKKDINNKKNKIKKTLKKKKKGSRMNNIDPKKSSDSDFEEILKEYGNYFESNSNWKANDEEKGMKEVRNDVEKNSDNGDLTHDANAFGNPQDDPIEKFSSKLLENRGAINIESIFFDCSQLGSHQNLAQIQIFSPKFDGSLMIRNLSKKKLISLWGPQVVDSWFQLDLDPRYMNFISSRLKVKDKTDHLEIEILTQEMNDLMLKFFVEISNPKRVFLWLSKQIGYFEAFRRLNTISRNITENLIQTSLSFIKSSGELSEILKLLKWGQKEERMLMSDCFGMNLIKLFELEHEKNQHELMDSKKWEEFEENIGKIYGKNEVWRRFSPIRLLMDNSGKLSMYRYPKEIPKSKEILQASKLKGINLTKVFVLITILDLEHDEFIGIEDGNNMHEFLNLFRSIIETRYNEYLPWYESPNRKFLMDHYGDKYLQRLGSISVKANSIFLYLPKVHDDVVYKEKISLVYRELINLEPNLWILYGNNLDLANPIDFLLEKSQIE